MQKVKTFLKNLMLALSVSVFAVAANAQYVLPTSVSDAITEATDAGVAIGTIVVTACATVGVIWMLIKWTRRGIRSVG